MSSGNRIIDRESIERFRQQVSLHRRYGWEIYEYGETPPQAVLAPTPSPAALRASRQRAGTDLINNVQVASRRHSWCRIWVDEGGEVRWRSVATPQTKLP